MSHIRESLQSDIKVYQGLLGKVNEIENIAEWIHQKCQGKIILSGIGKSGLIAKKIASTLCSVGTKALFIHPVEALHGDLGLVDQRDVFIGFSNSGETDELLTLLHVINGRKIPSVAITSKKNSTLALNSTKMLVYDYEKESCPLGLAPTTSTTLTLIIGDMIAMELMRIKNIQAVDFAFNHPSGSLGKRLLSTVGDHIVPLHKINRFTKSTLVFDIITEKSLADFGLILLEERNKIVAVFTDGDLRRILEIHGKEGMSLRLGEVCSYSPVMIEKERSMEEARELFKNKNVNTLLVQERNKIVGILRK